MNQNINPSLSKADFEELYNGADHNTKRTAWHMIIDGQPENTPGGRHRDIARILTEYESKYEDSTRIYTSELEHLMKRSFDLWDLVTSCIAFGYVIGRRAEKNHRRKNAKKIKAV